MNERIIILESYSNPGTANIVKARLESHGIHCYLTNENYSQLNPFFDQSVGGVKLKIFARDLERARKILADDQPEPED